MPCSFLFNVFTDALIECKNPPQTQWLKNLAISNFFSSKYDNFCTIFSEKTKNRLYTSQHIIIIIILIICRHSAKIFRKEKNSLPMFLFCNFKQKLSNFCYTLSQLPWYTRGYTHTHTHTHTMVITYPSWQINGFIVMRVMGAHIWPSHSSFLWVPFGPWVWPELT